jgi:hypothetical protein
MQTVYGEGKYYRVTLLEQRSYAFDVEDYVEPRMAHDDGDEQR